MEPKKRGNVCALESDRERGKTICDAILYVFSSYWLGRPKPKLGALRPDGHISESILGEVTLVTRYWGEGHISDSILGVGGAR